MGPRPTGLSRAVCIAACLAAAGCLQNDGTRWHPFETFDEVSIADERELGFDFDRDLTSQARMLHDPLVVGFLNDIGQSIVRQIEPQPFVYRFRVVGASSLNAFAVPGGYVYFHTGTLLAASSVDEIAGVMGHEIAHVKARHYARRKKKTQIPGLLANAAGLAGSVVTGHPGVFYALVGLATAQSLHFSREFESEADRLGAVWLTRAGYDPAGITEFFGRILEAQKQFPEHPLPYLLTHPEVEERIETVRIQADGLRPVTTADPEQNGRLRAVQSRIDRLLHTRRTSAPVEYTPTHRETIEPLIAEAERRAGEGDLDAALLVLARAQALAPRDPHVNYTSAEFLFASGRYDEAAQAYRRVVDEDPTRAQVFYKLGLAYRDAGERHLAVFALEQAALRAGDTSELGRRIDWEIEKLTFVVISESSFTEALPDDKDEPERGHDVVAFSASAEQLAWWGRVGEHFVPARDRLFVRWTDPSGDVAGEARVRPLRVPYVGARLEQDGGRLAPGWWQVDVLIDDDVVRTDRIRVIGSR